MTPGFTGTLRTGAPWTARIVFFTEVPIMASRMTAVMAVNIMAKR